MLHDKTVAVVVPAHNEQDQIIGVLETMPEFVDRIYVVDDGSRDDTASLVEGLAQADDRVRLIRHEVNRGVGAAIATGYKAALAEGTGVTAVMAGDGQMDPAELAEVAGPVALDQVDYCKGNRFQYERGLEMIPPVRKFGNFILSMLTKIVSGYWHLSDSQTGYIAIGLEALAAMDLDAIYPGYGCPIDILVKLNIAEMRVGEVPIKPLYNVGERSKMKIPRVIGPILRLMGRLFRQRLLAKYVVRGGHPLVFAYLLALLSAGVAILLSLYLVAAFIITLHVMKAALFMDGVALIICLQMLMSAMNFDFAANRHLCVHLRAPARVDRSPTEG